MNSRHQLEQRADRGAQRGAAHVWAEANRQIEPDLSPSTPLPARIGYVVVVVAILAGTIGVLRQNPLVEANGQRSGAVPLGSNAEAPGEQSDEPAPVLIEGMSLEAVARPLSRGDADEVVDSGGRTPQLIQVFADRGDPFGGPILVVENYEGGGMQPWGINLEPFEVDAFASGLTRADPGWTLSAESDLVEVASIDADSWFTDGWQFDFRSGSDRATLQSMPSQDGVWSWVAMLARAGADQRSVLIETTVLGQPGVLLRTQATGDESEGQLREGIIWADQQFSSVLRSSAVDGNTEVSTAIGDLPDRLKLVSRAEWRRAVDSADGPFGQSGWSVFVTGLLVLAVAASALVVLVRGPRLRSLALVPLLGVAWWFGPDSLPIVLAAVVSLYVIWRPRPAGDRLRQNSAAFGRR